MILTLPGQALRLHYHPSVHSHSCWWHAGYYLTSGLLQMIWWVLSLFWSFPSWEMFKSQCPPSIHWHSSWWHDPSWEMFKSQWPPSIHRHSSWWHDAYNSVVSQTQDLQNFQTIMRIFLCSLLNWEKGRLMPYLHWNKNLPRLPMGFLLRSCRWVCSSETELHATETD